MIPWWRTLVLLAACGDARDAATPREPTWPASSSDLCVTRGEVRGHRIVDAAVRGFAPRSRGDAAALAFTYAGPTTEVSELASGAVRHQLGLKLRAADSCNLIYVMWRVTPPEIVVQFKRNPRMTRHEECGTRGYQRLDPTHRAAPPSLAAGSTHRLAAAIDGNELLVWVDRELAWRGLLPEAARRLHGPAGFRTDNVAAQLALFAPTGDREAPCPSAPLAPQNAVQAQPEQD